LVLIVCLQVLSELIVLQREVLVNISLGALLPDIFNYGEKLRFVLFLQQTDLRRMQRRIPKQQTLVLKYFGKLFLQILIGLIYSHEPRNGAKN